MRSEDYKAESWMLLRNSNMDRDPLLHEKVELARQNLHVTNVIMDTRPMACEFVGAIWHSSADDVGHE